MNKHCADIITKDLLHEIGRQYDIAVPNYYLDRYECDVLRISKNGVMTEYEIKVSRSDFKNDAKKGWESWRGEKRNKHQDLIDGKRVNKFYFVVPEGMVNPSEVPPQFGLIYAIESSNWRRRKYDFQVVKKAKTLKKEQCSPDQFANVARNLAIKLFYAKRDKWIAEENYRNTIKIKQS